MSTGGKKTRREFLREGLRAAGMLALGGTLGGLIAQEPLRGEVWQIDPEKCTKCERCATECVMTPSAVKCVHAHAACGYCDLCFGYYAGERVDNQPTAENHMCPTDALKRTFIEDPYYQYVIDENKCIGCARCVKGCEQFGNGSLFMQVRHDRCLNCNECAIARVCPGQAFVRVPASQPYLLKGKK